MKKKGMNAFLHSGGVQKLLLTMKLTFMMMMFGLLQVSATVYSQATKFSFKAENKRVIEVLKEIEENSNFRFFYQNEQVDVERRVTVKANNSTVEEILDDVFKGQGIGYKVMEDFLILLSPEKQSLELFGNRATGNLQQKLVTGKVTDMAGMALPGVTVVVKGTTQGTVTNADGEYTLTNLPANVTLQFSFVGMKTQEIIVGSQTNINVTLEEEAIGIEEVVAIGYGTMKRQAVTGAVAKANLDPYKNVPVNNIMESLKGSVPGLSVDGISKAGQVAGINIRGQNSTAASNSPLIVLDGTIFSGSLGDIPTEDIENLTVLKDASAAAVYGSRSANGVILIETKKGSGINGKPKFEVKMSYGISDELKQLQVYDAEGYLQRLLDSRIANGLEADPAKIPIYLQPEEQKNYEATPDHKPTLENPYDLINQLGNTYNTTISVSNKTEKSSYYISTSLIKQRGVIINDEYKHISGRVNIDNDLTDWFSLGIKSYYSLRDYSGSSPDVGSERNTTFFSPWASVYNEDGSYKQFPQTTTSFNSPFWYIASEDIELYNNLNGIITGVVRIPWIKGLTYNVTYSNSLYWKENNTFFDENTVDGKGKNGIGKRIYNRTYNMLLDNMIKYNNTFSDKHNVDMTLLYSREHSAWESLTGYAEGFDNTVLRSYKLENGKTQTVDTGGGETYGIGLMARGTYTYNFKYSITGTVRRDGYSAFSKNKKWGVFPSVGVNWNISREGFMQNLKNLNNLTVRASYGTNGNQSISAYSTLAKMGTDKYIFYGDPSYTVTQYISTLANDDLGWESTTGLNFGTDFTFFKGRLSGAVDIYKTKTNDLMFSLALPTTSGKSSITSNIGEIQNKGIEINLHSVNIQKENFRWSSDFAFSLNRNKVVTIFGDDNNGDGKEDDLISSGYFIGKSLGTIYDYKVIGMWQQEEKDNGTIMQGLRPGDYKLEDVSNDGAITSEKDRQFLGNKKENFRWSWTNIIDYKDFSFMMYFYSIWGGNGWYLSDSNTPYFDGYGGRGDINHPVYDYWTPANTDAMFPRLDYNSNAAYKGRKYIDRSFIKLQKVSLTYNLTRYVKEHGINGLSLSCSVDNLFTYAPHWVGLDPETNSGLTASSIPSIRTYLLTLSVNF